MINIGVLGSYGKSNVAEIIKRLLNQNGKSAYIIGTSQDSNMEFENLIEDRIDYVIVEISREDILQKKLQKIKFDIIIQTNLEKESNELIVELQNIMCSVREKGYIIFNSDSIQKINLECENVYPVTYGLNGKTTVTASSIDDMQSLQFCYCLQRSIFTLQNTVVQPFEKPIIESGTYSDIYYYLSAFTCILILGYKF